MADWPMVLAGFEEGMEMALEIGIGAQPEVLARPRRDERWVGDGAVHLVLVEYSMGATPAGHTHALFVHRREGAASCVRCKGYEQAMKFYKSDLVLLLPPGVTEL